jgi:hypothetical protein
MLSPLPWISLLCSTSISAAEPPTQTDHLATIPIQERKGKGGGKAGPAKGRGKKKPRGTARYEDTILLRPLRLAWPAADLGWQHAFTPRWTLETGLMAGRYRPIVAKIVDKQLKENGFHAPISFYSFEAGMAWHPNQHFDKGFRLGILLKGISMGTEVNLQSNEQVSTKADLHLTGLAPILWTGYKHSWRSGLTVDLRLGGGPFFSTARAEAISEATVDGQSLGQMENNFEQAFRLPWISTGLGIGYSW